MSEQSDTKQSLGDLMELTRQRFVTIAPQEMPFDREMGYALQALRDNDYLMKVAENNPRSLQAALCNVGGIGLSLNRAENLCYLVPRNGKICLDVSYQGLCRIATNSGNIEWVQARLVHEQDTFTLRGVDEEPLHEIPNPFADRGEIIGVYSVAKLHNGDYLTEIMAIEEVEAIRNSSESYKAFVDNKIKTCPWHSHFGEMAKKTCVKRQFKMLPKTDKYAMERMALAVQVSHDADGYEQIRHNPETNKYTDDQKGYFDQLLEDDNALGLLMFHEGIGEGVWISLYNSFERGKIGQYKQLVDALEERGRNNAVEYQNRLMEAVEADDGLAIAEIAEEIGSEAMEFLTKAFPPQARSFIEDCIAQAGDDQH